MPKPKQGFGGWAMSHDKAAEGIICGLVLLTVVGLTGRATPALGQAQGKEKKAEKPVWEKDVLVDAKGRKLPYRLLTPAKVEPGKTYPLVLFFHAHGQGGTDNKQQIKGHPLAAASQRE